MQLWILSIHCWALCASWAQKLYTRLFVFSCKGKIRTWRQISTQNSRRNLQTSKCKTQSQCNTFFFNFYCWQMLALWKLFVLSWHDSFFLGHTFSRTESSRLNTPKKKASQKDHTKIKYTYIKKCLFTCMFWGSNCWRCRNHSFYFCKVYVSLAACILTRIIVSQLDNKRQKPSDLLFGWNF